MPGTPFGRFHGSEPLRSSALVVPGLHWLLYGFRACMPLLDTIPDAPVSSDQILDVAKRYLPEWTEDSFPGFLMNVAAGRVANRFNFGGTNMAVDAACGVVFSLGVHMHSGTDNRHRRRRGGHGRNTIQTPYAYTAFSKTHALSPTGQCRPFDANADGFVMSEGVGVVILKRLEDAERDGDRIYAVIKGVGTSSDGNAKGVTAPNPEGQLLAPQTSVPRIGILTDSSRAGRGPRHRHRGRRSVRVPITHSPARRSRIRVAELRGWVRSNR